MHLAFIFLLFTEVLLLKMSILTRKYIFFLVVSFMRIKLKTNFLK